MVEQREQSVADQVRRRLEAGAEEQHDRRDQLVVAELVALLLDVDELGQQVVGGLRAPLARSGLRGAPR